MKQKIMKEGRLKVKEIEKSVKLVLKLALYCGSKITVQIGKDVV